MPDRFEYSQAISTSRIGGEYIVPLTLLLSNDYILGIFPYFIRFAIIVSSLVYYRARTSYIEFFERNAHCGRDLGLAEYREFREKLLEGGNTTRLYAAALTQCLEWTDAFFGDRGTNAESVFTTLTGWRSYGPRWTSAAFDRCLFLALVYPFCAMLVVWALYGHVGVAEKALGLSSFDYRDMHFRRVGSALLLLAAFGAQWRGYKSTGILKTLTWAAVAVVFAFLSVGVGIGAGIGAFAGLSTGRGVFATVFAVAFSISFAIFYSVASIISAFMIYNHSAYFNIFVFFDAVVLSGAFSVLFASSVSAMYEFCFQHHGKAVFNIFFVLAILLVCFTFCWISAPLEFWGETGALLLFTGVLTLVNAPFDWMAIGMTRALLRQGLAPEGRGPVFYALLDAALALMLVAMLAVVCVIMIDAFNDVATVRGGTQALIFPLGPLLSEIGENPTDPHFWWIWLMLLSTLVPSAVNLVIASVSLIRGHPAVRHQILKLMPEQGLIEPFPHSNLVRALAFHLAGGVFLTGCGLYLLGAYVLPFTLRVVGATLFDVLQAIEAYNAPRQLVDWLVEVY